MENLSVIRKPRSLAEKVYVKLLKQIISGRRPAGEKLSEDQLCGELNTSRTPVREALLRLTREGIIERIPRRGCFVRALDRNYVRELFECRKLLECIALEEGFEHISRERLEAMRQKLMNPPGTSGGNSGDSLAVDEMLHEIICENCPNRCMADIIRRLRLQTSAFRTYRAYGTEKTRAISAERLEIIAAVIGNKKEKALRLLGEHIMRGASVVP